MGIDDLGKYPILQAIYGLLIFSVAMYFIVRGFFDKKKKDQSNPPPMPAEQRWFFDGPLVEALRYLRDGSKAQEQQARELREINEATRETNRLLDDIRRDVENKATQRRRRQD